MRVWTAVIPNFNLGSGAAASAVTLADAADFAVTPGNTKHVGTLVRIRGTINVHPNDTLGTITVGMGIMLADFAEVTAAATPNPFGVAFGLDEDVLWWKTLEWNNVIKADRSFHLDIDIKAKRRMDIEGTVTMLAAAQGNTAGVSIFGNLRLLWLVP